MAPSPLQSWLNARTAKSAQRPLVMGILNVTPDSFYDGGRHFEFDTAVAAAEQMRADGADYVDVGGESTRPGAAPVSENEEMDRVLPVIEALVPHLKDGVRLSIDTRKPRVAEAAIAAGAHIWNDVTALEFAPDSLETAVRLGVPVILMHARGTPETMQDDPQYDDVVSEVRDYLADRIAACEAAGIPRDRLIVDPGIGFGKTVEHNVALIRHMAAFTDLGCEVMLGASRKRFIASLDRGGDADERLGGSLAAVLAAWRQGASWFRVHDVAATRQALAVTKALETRS